MGPTAKVSSKHVDQSMLTWYRMLCSPAHNDLRSLFERFYEETLIAMGRPLRIDLFADLVKINGIVAVETIRAIPRYADGDAWQLAVHRARAEASLAQIVALHQQVQPKSAAANSNP